MSSVIYLALIFVVAYVTINYFLNIIGSDFITNWNGYTNLQIGQWLYKPAR